MKILVLQSELGVLRGGGESFTRSLFREFSKRGHEVTAVFVADRKGKHPVSLPAEFDTVPIPGWWRRKPGQAVLSRLGRHIPARHVEAWTRMQEAICWRTIHWHNRRFEHRVDRLFAGQWPEFSAVYVNGNVPLAVRAARFCPTLLMLPGPVSADSLPELRQIHAVCAHDDALSRMRSFLGDDVLELPLGLDTEIFSPGASPVRSQLGWSDRHLVIGYVGRLTHIKGVDLLAASFRELLRREPLVRLVFVGNGEERDNLAGVLRAEVAAGAVRLEPGKDQASLAPWYRALDLMVMPSRYETLSNALLEAMGCGVPFAASDIGGNRTLGQTGAGWLFSPGSVAALTECLTGIVRNRGELPGRGTTAARYARAKYSWAATALTLEKIIHDRLLDATAVHGAKTEHPEVQAPVRDVFVGAVPEDLRH